MRTLKRVMLYVGTVFTAVALVLGIAPSPALAAGSFGWSFNGTCCLNSRGWTTTMDRDIWIDVDSVSPYSTYDGAVQYKIQLYRDGWTDSQVGSDRTGSGANDFVWRGVDPGNFYFRITVLYPWRDQRTYTINGTVAYDGGVT